MLSVEEYARIYSMLDEVSPLFGDCGQLCGSICCSNDPFGNEESYIYLLPGEREYLESCGCTMRIAKEPAKEHFLPASWGEYVHVMHCPGTKMCNRAHRPIQCRTFPLVPLLRKKGVLEMIMCNDDLPYTCPIIRDKMEISEDFCKVTLEAWKLLIEDRAIRDLVKLDSKDRRRRLK